MGDFFFFGGGGGASTFIMSTVKVFISSYIVHLDCMLPINTLVMWVISIKCGRVEDQAKMHKFGISGKDIYLLYIIVCTFCGKP